MASSPSVVGINLYWLPLGAGGHSVRLNGKVFEAVAARLGGRERCDLYHSALEVRVPNGRFVIEQAPVWREHEERGVVATGAVGARAAGRFRLFRYEIRRWRDGVIPDIAEAVDSPHRLSDDPGCARRLLELVPQVPTPVWGRDELRLGEMWNSNSLISWLLARSGLDVESIQPPLGGRAPGWRAGIVMARRQQAESAHARVRAEPPVGEREALRWSVRHGVVSAAHPLDPADEEPSNEVRDVTASVVSISNTARTQNEHIYGTSDASDALRRLPTPVRASSSTPWDKGAC
jgi:hypothetical protein